MKRFLITLGSVLIAASAACVVIRFLKNNATGEGGDEFGDEIETEHRCACGKCGCGCGCREDEDNEDVE